MMKYNKRVPELRFPEFEGEWVKKKIQELVIINPQPENLPDTFFYIDLESVVGGNLNCPKRIIKNDAPSRAQRTLIYGDLLFQSVRPYQKNNYFFSKKESNYVASTGYTLLRNKEITPFLFQYIHTNIFLREVLPRCTGTSYPAINSTDLAKIYVQIPTLPEQTKITEFLTAIDQKLLSIKKKKRLLEDYKKGVMLQLFSQQIRFKDDNGMEYPKWERKRLGEIGEIFTGKTPSTQNEDLWNGTVLFVTPSDIHENKYQFITERTIKKNPKTKILPKGSIMFTCIASIGKMSLSVHPSVTNQQINSIVPYEQYYNEYLYYCLLNMVDYIKSTQSSNTLPIINKTEFSKFKIFIPRSHAEQTKIANFLSAIDDKIKFTQIQIEGMEQYKKGLLQKMFV